MHILVIDEKPLSAHALKSMMAPEGFRTNHCVSLEEGIEFAEIYEFDAIVMHPAACADIGRLRAAGIAIPILAILDDVAASSRIAALSLGADDCMSRPFDKSELGARLRASVRRSRTHPHSTIRAGNLLINLDTRDVRVGEERIHLTVTEYRVLEMLALRKGTTVSRERLFESLYDGRDDPEDHVINVFVCKLRKKIAAVNHGESYITTNWGSGYRLSEPAGPRAA
jgi:two-component system, cell cycle response regulator CtrA